MNTEIAQLIALVCHCNAAVRGISGPAFGLEHSTCRACAQISFARLDRADDAPELLDEVDEYANTPFEWVLKVVAAKPAGVRLGYHEPPHPLVPDRYISAFTAGACNWLLEVVPQDGASEYWVARWQVGDRARLDRRIWDVTYICLGEDEPTDAPPRPEADDELRAAITEIETFARETGADVFATAFRVALTELDGQSSTPPAYSDLAPPGVLSPSVQRLLDAAQSAWVFGGMGSWNDLSFEDEELSSRYEALSDRLWRALTSAAVQCANASFSAEHAA